MIIETPNGAVLEIYWRQRGSEPWSQSTALHFLSRYRLDRRGLQGLRWLLSDRVETGKAWGMPDPVILQRVSSLIATDRVIVAEYGWTERWPGSGFLLGTSWDSSVLFWRDQINLDRDAFFFKDWLQDLQGLIRRTDAQKKKKEKLSKEDEEELKANAPHISSLRKLVASAPGMPDFGVMSDSDVLMLVLSYSESGNLLPIYHRYPGIAEPSDDPTPVDPVDPKPDPNKPDPDDPDPFDPNDDPNPSCLLRASKAGTPFVTLPTKV